MEEQSEAGVTVERVLERYAQEHGTSSLLEKKSSLLFFVNGVMARLEHKLAEGDSVTVARLRGGG